MSLTFCVKRVGACTLPSSVPAFRGVYYLTDRRTAREEDLVLCCCSVCPAAAGDIM